METDGDFEVEIIIYNRHITRRMFELRMESHGRASVTQLVQKMGYGFGSQKARKAGADLEIRNLVGLKTIPTEESGEWKPMALEIAVALQIKPEKLWPGVLKNRIPASNTRHVVGKIGQPIEWLIMNKK